MSKKISTGVMYASSPVARLSVDGILVDPPQTTDDQIEKVTENSPAFSMLASRCTTESEFDKLELKVYSFAFALPHLVQTADKVLADDPRGAIVEMIRTGVSFRNISKTELTLHANTPIAYQHTPDKIYARLSGFYRSNGKKKGHTKSDDCHLKPGQTVTFKINWKNLPNEYTPLTAAKEGRFWMNLVNFAVEIKNINQETGAEFNDLSSMLSMMPKATYTKRQSNPVLETGFSLGPMQDTENFVLQKMAGSADLFAVAPISVQAGAKNIPGQIPLNAATRDVDVYDGLVYTQSATVEGDLFGVHVVNVTRANYGESQTGKETPKTYVGTGLSVKRVGGHDRPLDLRNYQGQGNRLIIVGMTVSATPVDPAISMCSFKWDTNTGYWILWDDFEQAPRAAPDKLTAFTPLSTKMPVMIVSGVYTREEELQLQEELMARGQNEYGQPFGQPKGFGDFLKKAIGVITIVGKVANFIGTLL